MHKKNIVIVSHSFEETITKCIMNNKYIFDDKITIISLQALLADYEIFDKITDAGTCIRWVKGMNSPISNADYFLLNRVLYVPHTLFSYFIKKDREYAQRELEAYLGFSFNAFSGIGNQLANGACVESLSLPQQWNKLKKELEINVPNYYWGPSYNNCLTNKNILVYSQIYNFLNWSISHSLPEDKHLFCFEKPQGQPVFIFSIGNAQLITSAISLTDEIQTKLKIMTATINKFLNHFISEILIFVDGINLNFGCINPAIIRSNKNQDFESFVCNHLVDEFYKCMN